MAQVTVLVNISKSRFVVSHKFSCNLHMPHFPACIEGYSVTLVETIGDDTNGTSSHVWAIDLALGDVV